MDTFSQELLKQLVTVVGGSAVAVAAIAYLAKSLLSKWMTQDVERFKASLKHESDMAIEELRNHLKMQAIEHEVRFTKLHEKQAEVVAEIYALLFRFYHDVQSLVSAWEHQEGPTKEEKFAIASTANEKFVVAFYPRKIYFPKATSKRIESLQKKLIEIATDFAAGRQEERQGAGKNYWFRAMEAIDAEAKPLLEDVHSEFQRLLGVVTLEYSVA